MIASGRNRSIRTDFVWIGGGLGLWVAAAGVVFAWVWPFAAATVGPQGGLRLSSNFIGSTLVAVFGVVLSVYLARQGLKIVAAARDSAAREELLGALRPRIKELRYSLHMLRRSLLAMIGLGIAIVYIGLAILGPYLAPFPYTFSESEKHVSPGGSATAVPTGVATNWTGLAWTNGSAALTKDGNYAQSGRTGDELRVYNFTLPIVFNDVRAVEVGVAYYSPVGHSVSVAVSPDEGFSWTPGQTVPFKTRDDGQVWYLGFTKDRSWGVKDVNKSNLMVRITHVQDQGPPSGVVYVDFVQVRVTFVGPVHPWGTNELGQDMMTGIFLGAGVDLRIGFLVVSASVAIGVILGLFSGYLGGKTDEATMRLTDIVLAIPGLVLALAFAAILERNLETVLLALVLVSWPGYTRLVRGQTLSVREVAYVEAARAVGNDTKRIVTRHILPNVMSPIIVAATLDLGTIVLATAALSFLGVGAQPYQPEWGVLIQRGYGYMISGYWWEFMIPGIAIFLFVLAFNLLGDGLRDLLDPRLRR
jgi:peptide/nickel transport system permease protein